MRPLYITALYSMETSSRFPTETLGFESTITAPELRSAPSTGKGVVGEVWFHLARLLSAGGGLGGGSLCVRPGSWLSPLRGACVVAHGRWATSWPEGSGGHRVLPLECARTGRGWVVRPVTSPSPISRKWLLSPAEKRTRTGSLAGQDLVSSREPLGEPGEPQG